MKFKIEFSAIKDVMQFLNRAVIFDFDGVICHSEPLHCQAWKQVCSQRGVKVDEGDYFNRYLGLSDYELFKNSLPNNGTNIATCVEEKIKVFIEQARGAALHSVPGTAPLIHFLVKEGISMAICTNATLREVNVVLEEIDRGALLPHFSTIVTIDDVKNGKPSPEGYLLAAQKLGYPPSQCIAIEDSLTGMKAAKAAGMEVIALNANPSQEMLALANKTVSSLESLFC